MRVLGLVLLLVVLPTSLAGAAPGLISISSATYEDERGEQAGAPDIATVSVSNSDRGAVTFFLSIPSHPQLTQDMRIRIWLADGDPSTGLTEGGADRFLLVDGFLFDLGTAVLYDCAGAVCSPSPHTSEVAFSYARGASFTVPADALGIRADRWGSTRLDFLAVVGAGYAFDPQTRTFDVTNVRVDMAPSPDDYWRYAVRIGPGALVAKSLTTTPAVVRAGRSLRVRLSVVRDDTGTPIRSGAVACAAHAGAVRVPSRPGRFVEQQAQCVLDLPRGSSGRILRASISVRREGLTARRSFVRTIR